jgi:hypothetical protein
MVSGVLHHTVYKERKQIQLKIRHRRLSQIAVVVQKLYMLINLALSVIQEILYGFFINTLDLGSLWRTHLTLSVIPVPSMD